MTSPVLARLEGSHRYYLWGKPPEGYWSVTTIIDGGVPKFLTAWAAKVVADLVITDLDGLRPHSRARTLRRRWERSGRAYVAGLQAAGKLTSITRAERLPEPDAVARWLKGQPERIRDAAAELGSDVHSEADQLVKRLALDTTEAYARGVGEFVVWPDRLALHMASFQQFLADWQPVFLATEATVFNRTQAYAGTLDAIAILLFPASFLREWGIEVDAAVADDERIPVVTVIDYKSGRGVYPTVALQLASYSRAEFVGLPDMTTRLPMPQAQLGAVLHLTPTGYALRPVRIGQDVFDAFLHVREVYRFNRELASKVLGPPLERVAA